MAPRARGYPLIAFAFTLPAVGAAYLGLSTAGQRPALASPPPVPQQLLTAIRGASCPLSVGKQIHAVKAFRQMMPVFRHPRCENCHGAFDIFSKKHPGEGQLDRSMDFREPMSPDVRMGAFAEQCEDCHDGLQTPGGERGWTTSPPPMFFVDEKGRRKSDEQLCKQIKEQEETGRGFVGHIENDHEDIQFIAAAFVGDRALGKEGLKQYKLTAQPAPGTQGQLTEKARDWVNILGEAGYKASPECGCVLPKIKLQVQHRSAIDPNHISHRAGQIGFSGDANFEVTLTAVHEAHGRIWYTGTKSLVRPLQVYHVARGCRGTASEKEDWLWSAQVDTASEQMTLQWGFTTSDEKGQSVCIRGGHRSEMPLDPSIFGGQSDEPLVMPLDSAATKQVTGKEEHGSGQEWLTIKVLAVP